MVKCDVFRLWGSSPKASVTVRLPTRVMYHTNDFDIKRIAVICSLLCRVSNKYNTTLCRVSSKYNTTLCRVSSKYNTTLGTDSYHAVLHCADLHDQIYALTFISQHIQSRSLTQSICSVCYATMSLAILPPGLVSDVVANSTSQSTLYNLAQCSRQLSLCMKPHLYRRISTLEERGQQNERLRSLASVLIRRPDLARLVDIL